MTPIEALIQSIATAPGLACAVVIVYIFARGQERIEKISQDREDQREEKRMRHETALAERYADIGTKHVEALDQMVDRIETSHRDIFGQHLKDQHT